jgi:hypothetical protein
MVRYLQIPFLLFPSFLSISFLLYVVGSESDNWRVIVEDGREWREGSRVMFVHDNTNNTLRLCVGNKNLQVGSFFSFLSLIISFSSLSLFLMEAQIAVMTPRETPSWWIAEVISPSWKVPFYTLEPLNHDCTYLL